MKKRIVIHRNCLPPTLPITGPITFWLLLEHFSAPDWGYGVFWTLTTIICGAILVACLNVEHKKLPLFGDTKEKEAGDEG